MTLQFKRSALEVVANAFADVLLPPVPMPPSQWATENLVVPDGPQAGAAWDLALTPYIKEPLDLLGPDSGVNQLAAMKSAQTGFTTLLIAAIGHSIDRDPCRMMIVQPTDAALSDFNRDKLQPAIESTKALKRKVAPQTSRSSEGSTTYSKKYPGGSLTLAIATSAADLRSKTIKKLLRDEIDQYPDDLDGQGDPIEISDGRLMSFLSSGDWKKVDISTPTIKGASKIEARYAAGDQRRWHVPCSHCDEEFVLEFGANFRFEQTFPHRAHYVSPCCGSIIEAHEKNALVRRGRWVATNPRPGAFPSYHFDTFSSPFVPWDEIAKAHISAGDDPQKLKTFWNLWLGLPYEIKGDAPDHKRLLERREEGITRGHVPSRGLMLVGAADVQMRGIWVEITAFAPNRESWVVDAFYIDGGTESFDAGAFERLAAQTIDREFPDAFGRKRRLDAFAIDSGYRSHVVYAWVRKNQRLHDITGRDTVLAVDGRDGWGKPPIGTPSLVDIDLAGHKVKKGCQLWPVGTWPLKGAFYADLRKEGLRSGGTSDPGGYCHFGSWLDETYFRQITAEYLADDVIRGKIRKFWKLKASERDNHLLDCRIYNLATAEYLGLSSLTDDEWAQIARIRGLPDDAWRPNLFTQLSAPPERPLPQPAPVAEAPKDDIFAKFASLNARN
ncbi:phage terminase large subunit family protein [Methylocella tundrae]|uniref:Terminase GpA n=1 Tax=Methylocella tundrae TaxID=227605 RepID=A0A4V6IMC3_METTU|nr:terminase gpA endonuclease subunit [Methylocella tundrae]WPP05498.1 terminase gpA endonuclease subunit [Methylocella tundrae]VFU07923.1 Terminase GpA [Methylocella tundrae]